MHQRTSLYKKFEDQNDISHCLIVSRSCLILILVFLCIPPFIEPLAPLRRQYAFVASHRRPFLYYSIPSDYYYEWNVSSCGADVVSDVLLEMGAVSAQVVLNDDEPVSGEDFHRTGRWNTESRSVIFSVSKDTAAERLVEGVCHVLDLDLTVEWSRCAPMEVPLIMEREQMQVIGPQLINISVGHKQLCIASAKLSDANQWAFGDGNHPSTRVALKGLETYVTRNTLRVLDYGCGTGILGIAAVVLGATEVVAVDISTCALELTRENWERNVPHEGDATLSILHASDYQPEPRHDIIVANMPANTLMSVLASLLASLKQDGGGMLLFSGYSSRESIQVSGPVIQAGLMELEPIYDSGWVLQVFCASGTVNDENYSDVP